MLSNNVGEYLADAFLFGEGRTRKRYLILLTVYCALL